jgi:hypothetical protein
VDIAMIGRSLALLSGKELVIYSNDGEVCEGAVVGQGIDFSTVGFDTESSIFLANSDIVAFVRPMTTIELQYHSLFQDVQNSVMRACKIVREWITDDDRRRPVCLADRLVERLESKGVQFDLGDIATELSELLAFAASPPIDEKDGSSHGSFWRGIVSQLTSVLSETALDVVVLLSLLAHRGHNGIVSTMLPAFHEVRNRYAPIDYLNDLNALPPPQFFTGGFVMPAVPDQAPRHLARLLDSEKVCQSLREAGADFSILEHFAKATNCQAHYFFASFRLNRVEAAARQIIDEHFPVDRILAHDIVARLFSDKSYALLNEFVRQLPDPTPNVWAYLFLSAIEHGEFESAHDCIERCPDDEKRVDFLRLFIHSAIEKRKLSAIFDHYDSAHLAVAANELMSYSSSTVAVGAMLYHRIGDVPETISALYLLGRTLLRSVSRFNLERAASAFILCLAFSEGSPDVICARSPADSSLVTRRIINRLLLKVEAILAFPDVENWYRKNHNEILLGLLETGNETRTFEFAKVCTVDELSKFCNELVRRPASSDAVLSQILALDKRKWNFRLHSDTFRAFLGTERDPPAWIIDAMVDVSFAQLIILCEEFRRGDIFDEVFTAIEEKGRPISRYFLPLLERARPICGPQGRAAIDRLMTKRY